MCDKLLKTYQIKTRSLICLNMFCRPNPILQAEKNCDPAVPVIFRSENSRNKKCIKKNF